MPLPTLVKCPLLPPGTAVEHEDKIFVADELEFWTEFLAELDRQTVRSS